MLLACQNISKAFGTKEVLKDINFHVNEKEKIAIVGMRYHINKKVPANQAL